MDTSKKTTLGRISVWILVFALILTALSASFTISAHAKNGVVGEMGDAAKDMVEDVGDAAENAVDQVKDEMTDATDGKVNDSDGVIGNEKDEPEAEMDEGRTIGWLGLVIAIVIVLIAIVLIVILIPRKKKR